MTAKVARPKWTPGKHSFAGPADYVDFTIAYPCTFAEVIQRLAEQRNLRVEGLPDEWNRMQLPDGMKLDVYPGWSGLYDPRGGWHLIVRGSALEKVKCLAGFFENVDFKFSARILHFRIVEMQQALTAAETRLQIVASLLEAAPRQSNGRIADAEWLRIGIELDKAKFHGTDYLEGESRRRLASHNQKHSKDGTALFTFAEVYGEYAKDVRRTLGRMRDQYRKNHPIS